MTEDVETLKQAITKAIDGGYDIGRDPTDEVIAGAAIRFAHGGLFPMLIFQHSFAKALWGEVAGEYAFTPPWKFHLQEMVVSENPIHYLRDNMPV